MTYSDLIKWQMIENDYNQLKQALTDCYTPQDNDIMLVDITALKQIGKNLLPLRYQDCNYQQVR